MLTLFEVRPGRSSEGSSAEPDRAGVFPCTFQGKLCHFLFQDRLRRARLRLRTGWFEFQTAAKPWICWAVLPPPPVMTCKRTLPHH